MNKLLMSAAALLLLTNVMVLAGVAYNRSGEPEASVTLTERELVLLQSYSMRSENSGMDLALNWNVIELNDNHRKTRGYSLYRTGSPQWLNEDKLRQLAFDVDALRAQRQDDDYLYNRLPSKEVIYVFEYDGDSFQQLITQLEAEITQSREALNNKTDDKLALRLSNQQKWLLQLQVAESRLMVIDAGLDMQALRETYSNNNKYLLLRGEVQPYFSEDKLLARVKDVFISSVHVPLPHQKIIAAITDREAIYNLYSNEAVSPRYQLKLNIGKRLEPWIEAVTEL